LSMIGNMNLRLGISTSVVTFVVVAMAVAISSCGDDARDVDLDIRVAQHVGSSQPMAGAGLDVEASIGRSKSGFVAGTTDTAGIAELTMRGVAASDTIMIVVLTDTQFVSLAQRDLEYPVVVQFDLRMTIPHATYRVEIHYRDTKSDPVVGVPVAVRTVSGRVVASGQTDSRGWWQTLVSVPESEGLQLVCDDFVKDFDFDGLIALGGQGQKVDIVRPQAYVAEPLAQELTAFAGKGAAGGPFLKVRTVSYDQERRNTGAPAGNAVKGTVPLPGAQPGIQLVQGLLTGGTVASGQVAGGRHRFPAVQGVTAFQIVGKVLQILPEGLSETDHSSSPQWNCASS